MTANGLTDGLVVGAGKASDRESELAIRALIDAKSADERKRNKKKKSEIVAEEDDL